MYWTSFIRLNSFYFSYKKTMKSIYILVSCAKMIDSLHKGVATIFEDK